MEASMMAAQARAAHAGNEGFVSWNNDGRGKRLLRGWIVRDVRRALAQHAVVSA
jgi:hypothetical protein